MLCFFLYGVAVYYCCQTKNKWRKLTISLSLLLIPATLKGSGCALAHSSSPGEGAVWVASEWWVSLLGCFPTNFAQAESSGKLRTKAKDDCSGDGWKSQKLLVAGLCWSRRTYSILVNESHPFHFLEIRSSALQLELGAHTSCHCRLDFAGNANVPCHRV